MRAKPDSAPAVRYGRKRAGCVLTFARPARSWRTLDAADRVVTTADCLWCKQFQDCCSSGSRCKLGRTNNVDTDAALPIGRLIGDAHLVNKLARAVCGAETLWTPFGSQRQVHIGAARISRRAGTPPGAPQAQSRRHITPQGATMSVTAASIMTPRAALA